MASEGEEKLFGATLDVGYVQPYMWAGWQLSRGACMQPAAVFSVWNINLGIFWNLYGSERDRDVNSQTDEPIKGEYKKGFGMCDEVQLFVDRSFSWDWFSLSTSYWHLAYTWGYADYSDTTQNKAICEWFGSYSAGELTIVPAFQLGPFSVFTEQNLVIVANKRDEQHSAADTSGQEFTVRRTDLGSYHGVFGVSWAKEATDKWSIELVARTEWATWQFIRPWLGGRLKNELMNRNIKPHGIYHITIGSNTSYNLLPNLSVSANLNVQFITNYWIRKNDTKVAKGCIPYGGMHVTYNWSW
jgi:hypothetical protein